MGEDMKWYTIMMSIIVASAAIAHSVSERSKQETTQEAMKNGYVQVYENGVKLWRKSNDL